MYNASASMHQGIYLYTSIDTNPITHERNTKGSMLLLVLFHLGLGQHTSAEATDDLVMGQTPSAGILGFTKVCSVLNKQDEIR